MTTITTAPTVAELQKKIAKLQSDNDALVDAKLQLEYELELTRDNQQEDEKARDAGLDRLQRIADDIHDQARHHGPVRFCATSPCHALNTLVEEFVL